MYLSIIGELGARHVLDIGCGTGSFAVLLAQRGYDVTAVDPAGASLAVARAKPGGESVRWIAGDATAVGPLQADAATMTGNVAQAIEAPAAWDATLAAVHDAVRPGGHIVFETRDPAARAWEQWTRDASYRTVEVAGHGTIDAWVELTSVELPVVSFRWTFVFHDDDAVLTSDSTLRFREQEEIEEQLARSGFVLDEVRGAPDRPGRELVFLARRPR